VATLVRYTGLSERTVERQFCAAQAVMDCRSPVEVTGWLLLRVWLQRHGARGGPMRGVGLSRAAGPVLVVAGPVVVAGEDVTGAGWGFGGGRQCTAGPACLF
jgi:hypothetical protein